MKEYALFVFFLFSVVSIGFAQDTTSTQNSLRSGTITSQFDYIYRVSNGFQEYEVVKKAYLEQLKSNVLDSVQTLSKKVSDLNLQMSSLNDSVSIVKERLSAEMEEKNQAIADRDNFNFLGIGIQKTLYSTLMWTLVAILSGALAFFAMQYFKSFGRIKKAEKDFLEVQEEFDQHRKNTLDRERKLKRELIDAQMGRN
ncbi:hypothetical protein J0A67_15285 [Algoriphagus aestuariicola]|uniref:tRNA (Guanine-N1)-methyltransferase n=1 Tax=Algoriphagus aestuariicola TaxID=1852016 RepID=A0ABS3BVC4_9BACT|nr:hypothetical protein [Algoriphagus aestuariicola]MBN7802236.1 hypothetical protein [Algoriphagus aestuariicola]